MSGSKAHTSEAVRSSQPADSAVAAQRLWELWRAGPQPDVHQFLKEVGLLPIEQLVAVLAIDQRERWRLGIHSGCEAYFQTYPQLCSEPRAFSLIVGEMSLRLTSGMPVDAGEYRRRFPEFREQLALLDSPDAVLEEIAQWQDVPEPGPRENPAAINTVRLVPDWMSASTYVETDRPAAPPPPPPTCAAEPQRPQMVGPYQIVRTLAHGGMGVVYQAVDTRLGRPVALKMVLAGQHVDGDVLARFRAEAQAVARLEHPNIVHIYEVSEHDGLPCIALEYVDGCNLQQFIGSKPMMPVQAAELARTLARTIDFAHQRGIIHRDIKPGNILMASNGQLKVTDFGLAKPRKATHTYSRPGEVVGTPNYMAPEQAEGIPGGTGPATDVYSMGAVLYEMLTGEPPFSGCSPMETLLRVRLLEPVRPSYIVPRIPRDLETICRKCLRKDRHERYPSAAALADDLERFIVGEPILARPIGVTERIWKWVRRHPTVAFLGAAVAALIIIGYALVFFQWQAAVAARVDADLRNRELSEARTTERQALEKARNAVERQGRILYAQYLSNAELEWLTGDADKARQDLESCPVEQRGWEWAYLRRRIEGTDVTVPNPPHGPSAITVLPDGKRYATLSLTGAVLIHDLAGGTLNSSQILQRNAMLPHECAFTLGTFSADASLVAAVCVPPMDQVGASKSRLGIWEVATGKLVRSWPVEAGIAIRLAMRADGRQLALMTGTRTRVRDQQQWGKGEVVVLDVQAGNIVFDLKDDKTGFVDAAFSLDGRTLALTAAGTPFALYDLNTKACVKRHHDAKLEGRRIFFAPDGKRVIVHCLDKLMQFTMAGERRDIVTTDPGELEFVFPSPDGTRLAVAWSNNSVRLYDTESWHPLQWLVGHRHWVFLVAFSDDNQRVVTQSLDGRTKVWDLARGRDSLTLGRGEFGTRSWIPSFVIDRKGERIYAASDDLQVRVFDAKTRERFASIPVKGEVRSLALSPDDATLAIGYDTMSGDIDLVQIAAGRVDSLPNAHQGCLTCVAFSPDGTRLGSASEDGLVRIWDVASRKMIVEFSGLKEKNRFATWLAFHPSGKQLAIAGTDGNIRICTADSARPLSVLRAHDSPATCCVFSADGRWLATANNVRNHPNASPQIKIWNWETGELHATLTGHKTSVWHLAFSPDGRRLASAGEDWTVKIWEPRHGEMLFTLKGHGDDIRCVAFTPDGHSIISSGDDPFLRVWDGTPLK